ncbi:hypothetical protein DFR47_10737 [Pseudochrobactrum asaccharolyticum]|jgi:hypothetical protein|uniref:Uncharacterized protein n=1 Tax=Pseudochrobactrum asaccharolyticum TaxID=354351 RepID=A0A366DSF7_9HYPH|nr:hypothetical protein DFR47_10737 [Pseudochrobactrum asaccharolyticum]
MFFIVLLSWFSVCSETQSYIIVSVSGFHIIADRMIYRGIKIADKTVS